MSTLRGHFLAASPQLPDSNFARTVVLILEHNDHGALGLVLNRPSNTTVRDLFAQLENQSVASEHAVRIGGPVEGPVMSLHGEESLADECVLPGVYLTSSKRGLHKLVTSEVIEYLLFRGYSGWGTGQLENELKVGGWLIAAATPELVFTSPVDELWKRILEFQGRNVLRDALGLDEFPDDPTLN